MTASKAEAFERYSKYYLSTNGQVYWSDTHQLSTYLDDYHKVIDARTESRDPATEMITEIYVPRPRLPDFMADVATTFRTNGVPIIYGTVRLIEKDDDSFLGDFVEDPTAIAPATAAARALLTEAIEEALEELNDRERAVVRLRFGLDDGQVRTLEEVGKEFGVTRERIRQIESKTLAKLRHPTRSQRLRDYLEEP